MNVLRIFNVYYYLIIIIVVVVKSSISVKLSSSLLRLKSINDLSIIRGKTDGLLPSINKGNDAIQHGLQVVQRLQLQLDRSDGRPASITIGNIASKYSMLISSVLRTVIEDKDTKLWTTVLGPLEYVGFRIKEMIQQENSNYVIDFPLLIKKMKKILLDISSNDEDPMLNKKDDISADEIKNLSVLLSQVALRYALNYDQLQEGSQKLGIKIMCDDQLLPIDLIEAVLSLDFDIPYRTEQSIIDINLQDICTWRERNQ